MNNPITTIDKALVNGGVTDGTRTVFYKDVESVIVETTSRRPIRKKLRALVSGSIGSLLVILLLLSLPGSVKEFFSGFIGNVFFLVSASVAFTVMGCSRTHFDTVLRISTRTGVTKLVYSRSWHNPQEIGTTIAEILNHRRGQAPSPETADQSYSLYINENYKEIPFFRLENNQLRIYSVWSSPHESGEDALTLEAEIDLRDVVSLDCLDRSSRYSNGYEHEPILGRLVRNGDSGMQWDLVFTFRSGQKVTHFVREPKIFGSMTPIDSWVLGELLEGLAKEMSTYLKSGRDPLGRNS